MTALQALRQELFRLQSAQAECIAESGYIKSACRYRYQILVNQARHIKESIEWLEQYAVKDAG